MEGRLELSFRLRAALDEIPALVVVFGGPDLTVLLANRELPGGIDVRERYLTELRHVLDTGETVHEQQSPIAATSWDVTIVPLRDEPGSNPSGVALHAVEVTGLVEARRRFQSLSEANVMGVTITDEQRIHEANDAFLRMVGRTREDLEAGLRWTDITDPESAEADHQALESLIRTGVAEPYEKVYVRPDGTRASLLLSGSALSREPLRVLATYYELAERKSAEAAIAGLLARTRRLQEITGTLSASNSAVDIARAVIHHGLEELTASAGVLLRFVGEERRIEHAVGFDRDLVGQWRRFPGTLPGVLLDPTGEVVPVGMDLPHHSAIVVPLTGGDGATLGIAALTFRGPRELDQGELDFLDALARQAGLALDRIRLYEDRAYVARKLQEGLLPERLDDVPGLEAAVVYESTAGGGEVGGDFYDLFESGPGRWTLVVGDVCGKGTEAAVITGLARYTIRAIARTTASPAEILEFLNGALRRRGVLPAFCTVGCATLVRDPAGGFSVTASSGGHPYPLLLRSKGTLEPLVVTGTMLGVAEQADLHEVKLHLAPGDALVVYTDGVTDARRVGGERFGEDRLLAALRRAESGTADAIAESVELAVRSHLPGPSADDRAILVVRAAP
jgi:PAS domain S-box-containing protein